MYRYEKNEQLQEEKHVKRFQVLLLQFCKFEQELQKTFKDVSLKYDVSKNRVKFEGLSGEVTPAIVQMYEFISKIVKTEVRQFSKLLQTFLQSQPVYRYVNNRLRERNVIGVWEFSKGEETLTVFSMSDQEAVKAAHLIKESVKETPVVVKNEARPLLTSEEWQSKAQEIEQQGEGLIKIISEADKSRIIILCTDKWEGLSREYIEDFLRANTIYEEILNLKPGMMRYLQMNCANAITNVGTQLQNEKGNVAISNTGIVIRATWTGLKMAKFAIDKILREVEKHREVTEVSKQVADIESTHTRQNFTQASTNAMSQHYVDCETCGCYSDFYCNACHQRMCGKCREEHLKNPDNTKHKISKYKERKMRFLSNPCKLHPMHQMVLFCKKCQKAICALCTTSEHEGHGFLDLEEVCTEKFRARFEDIRNIRDNILPQSRVNLEESQRITKETKDNVEDIKRIMAEKAIRFKELVDTILTESLQKFQTYEGPAVLGAENQEKKMVAYVSRMETLLEEYKTSISSENSEEFLSDMRNTPTVPLDPIPALATASPFAFCEGELCKDDICKQFGFLQN